MYYRVAQQIIHDDRPMIFLYDTVTFAGRQRERHRRTCNARSDLVLRRRERAVQVMLSVNALDGRTAAPGRGDVALLLVERERLRDRRVGLLALPRGPLYLGEGEPMPRPACSGCPLPRRARPPARRGQRFTEVAPVSREPRLDGEPTGLS